ncbi:MAG: secondary thiamine-phosphate synthase enzyme YjbQ [Pyrinomonadaceae bacterium]|nr:secondary thiamine-phosphate synthase enzyme YjbQ [Pyrinomonadaceae bacterium]
MIEIAEQVEAELRARNGSAVSSLEAGTTPPITEESFEDGVCVLFVKHTTCGLTINENADPDVKTDMLGFFDRLIPQYDDHFRHFEHNSDAHIKSSLVGSSVTVPFENGKLCLGRWQGIYLCEFDGPREREILIKFL